MKFHNMLYQIAKYCGEHECDTCPLLDKTADMCSLHSDIPRDWDIQKIKEVLLDGDNIKRS